MDNFDMQMPDEERKRQAWLALAMGSAGLLGAPKGREWQAVGQGLQQGLLSMNQQKEDWYKQRGQQLTQQAALQKFEREKKFDDYAQSLLTGGGASPYSQQTSAPGAQSSPQPGGVPGFANPNSELAFALMGKKDVADVIHRISKLEQGPQGTLIRNGTVVGQVTPHGVIMDGKFTALPPDALKAALDQKRAEAGVAAESEIVEVPMGDGTTQRMTKAQALSRFAPQQQQPQQPMPQSAPQQQPPSMATMDWSKVTPQDLSFLQREGAPVPQPPRQQFGVTDPLAVKAKESHINVTSGAQTELNSDWVKNSYRPVIDASNRAKTALASIDVMDRLPINSKTGWGADAQSTAARVLAGLGVPSASIKDFAANSEIFQSKVLEHNWELLSAQKGPQTEGDAQRAMATWVKLSNTPRANEFLRDYTRATHNLVRKNADFYHTALPGAQKAGNLAAIDAEWAKVGVSLWDDPAMKKWESFGAQEQPQSGPTPNPGGGRLATGRIGTMGQQSASVMKFDRYGNPL